MFGSFIILVNSCSKYYITVYYHHIFINLHFVSKNLRQKWIQLTHLFCFIESDAATLDDDRSQSIFSP
jgi:hypothetical protein